MLTQIQIQNIAIASQAVLTLQPGMTVLTGETGAGKSILIDALKLLLGDKASREVIKHDCEQAIIEASFEIAKKSEAHQWLVEHGLNENIECHIRRLIPREGRSRIFINNHPVNLSTIRELADMLINIHGQQEHQSLINPVKQRQLLDNSSGYIDLLNKLYKTATDYQAQQKQLTQLKQKQQDRQTQLSLLSYQINELSEAGIDNLSIDKLFKEHERLTHISDFKKDCAVACEHLKADSYGLDNQINQVIYLLEKWRDQYLELSSILDIAHEINTLCEEAHRSLDKINTALAVDPKRLFEIEQLMNHCQELARKHHVDIQTLPALYQEKCREQQAIEQDHQSLTTLSDQVQVLDQHYRQLAKQLHKRRCQHALDLSKQITDCMQTLGMQGGQFEIRITANNGQPTEHGDDQIEFWVSTNPGYPLQPLNKVASGGELSRINLAISVICDINQVPTLIFDEIDSGIGGAIAEIVGKQLQRLATKRQVLCVTHLPQIASQATHHYRVVKTTNEQTQSQLTQLDEAERIEEIARMLGGANMTQRSLAHAKELLTMAHQTTNT